MEKKSRGQFGTETAFALTVPPASPKFDSRRSQDINVAEFNHHCAYTVNGESLLVDRTNYAIAKLIASTTMKILN